MNADNKYKFAALVLAAGNGTRMKSAMPKVMHTLAGKPMIAHVLGALRKLSPDKTAVVVAPQMDAVTQAARKEILACTFATQEKQLGTGHAALCAEPLLSNYPGTILVLCADTPLLTPETLSGMLKVAESADLVVLGFRPADPNGYGRLVVDGSGQVEEIVECRDANPEQKKIPLCNAGVYAVKAQHLFSLLKKVGTQNAAGEQYLTDIVGLADDQKLHCRMVEADAGEVMGVNSRAQLAIAESALQNRLRLQAMEQGATLLDPQTIYFSMDTKLGQDVTIHPQVVFGPDVVVESGAEIRSFSHLEGATVKTKAVIGPFARLRPGAVIGEDARIGNFVEIKESRIGKGACANHLSYIGDAEVGVEANIGAGTITCNYDGFAKHKTVIADLAFIGSNTALVAPVTIGRGAIVGAGSVITQNVEPDALAIARATQTNKPGGAQNMMLKKRKAP